MVTRLAGLLRTFGKSARIVVDADARASSGAHGKAFDDCTRRPAEDDALASAELKVRRAGVDLLRARLRRGSPHIDRSSKRLQSMNSIYAAT